MSRTTVTRTIRAPIERVFGAVAHIEDFSKIVPAIVSVEFLSEQHRGVGTRFRETRMFGKREAATTLEVTEYEPNRLVRFVSDEGGTLWDTVFTLRELDESSVEIKLVMDARAYRLLSRVVNPLIRGMVRKAIEGDMDAVKLHCEKKPLG